MTAPEPHADIDLGLESPASAAEWLEAGPEGRHPCGLGPREAAPEPEAGASEVGRFEPTPYFFGISDDPGATWAEARASRGPEFPGLRDLYRAQDEVIAAFCSAERQADLEPEAEP